MRDLPRLLPYLETDSAGSSTGAEAAAPVEDADAGIRRWRLRRRQLTLLLISAVVFLMLSAGGQSGFFIRHLPLLIFAALLVMAGTAPPVSPRTPWRRDPLRRGVTGVLALSGAAMVPAVLAYFVPAYAIQALSVYMLLGTLALFLLASGWLSGRNAPMPAVRIPSPPSPAPRPEPSKAEEDPSRPAVLQVCREALEQIAGNAPPGARATGWLDLSGFEGPGRKVWWRLRLPWENGARLRLAGIDDDGFDGGRVHRLLATLAVDPRRWRTERGGTRNATFGLLTVETFEVTPSRVSIRVLSPERAFRPYDLIEMLKALEERVHPVAASGGPE